MNKSTHNPLSNIVRLLLIALLAITLTVSTGQTAQASPAALFANPAPVNLGRAADFVILSKTGITTTGTTAITGDIGVSPIAAASMTGFGLIMDSTNTFSTSSLITGKAYAANYAVPTPAKMTTAISNMETAYTNAAGRAPNLPTELHNGDLSGKTLPRGVYKWSTGVSILSGDLTLSGSSTDVWIFQMAGDLTVASGRQVILSGGAKASNVFWQVGGPTGVAIGSTAHVEGTILAAKAITLVTGASLNGRMLSHTAVTLQSNAINGGGPQGPAVSSITCVNLSSAAMQFTVTFDEPVTGVNAPDFTLVPVGVTGATIGIVTGSGTTWTVPVNTGTGDGTIGLNLNASGTGIKTLNEPIAGGFTGSVCENAPSVTVVRAGGAFPQTLAATTNFTVTFSELMDTTIPIATTDFLAIGTSAGTTVTGIATVTSGLVYTLTVTNIGNNGTIGLAPQTTLKDLQGTFLTAPYMDGETYTMNFGVAPTVPILTLPLANAIVDSEAPILLDWNDSTQVMALMANWNYDLQVSDTPLFTSSIVEISTTGNADPALGLADSSYIIAPSVLNPNTTYYWHVRSVNGYTGAFSAWSLTRVFRTKLGTPAPIAPGVVLPGLPTVLDNKRPTFSWTPVTGATSYTILIFKTGVVAPVTATSLTAAYTPAADLVASTVYTWKVRANGSTVGNYSPTFTFTTSANPPATPVLFAPANGVMVLSSAAQTLDWNPALGAASFEVAYATNNAFTDCIMSVVNDNTVLGTNLPIGALSPGRTYYWHVRSWSIAGATGTHSAWSAVRTINVRFVAPTLVSPLNGATGVSRSVPVFVWDSGANGLWTNYTLQIALNNSFSSGLKSYTITAPLQTFTMPASAADLLGSHVYFWRVRINGIYAPIFSATQSFTTAAP